MTDQQQMLAHARSIVSSRATSQEDSRREDFAVACLMDLMQQEQTALADAAAQGNPIAIIQQACSSLDEQAYSNDTETIRTQLGVLRDTMNTAFRRGVHTAVQIIVDDFSDLVRRREQSGIGQSNTEVIKAMALRLARLPMPHDDPGPADPAVPAVPQSPRPEVHTLLQVASLAAEESGLPITLDVTSDGVRVLGRRQSPLPPAIRAVSWGDIATAEVPVLSLAVQQVIDELRS
jgi:hypothetical protein